MKTPFKLRSGNTTPFKMMGSSPLQKGKWASIWAGTKAGFKEFVSLGSGGSKLPGEATVDAFKTAYKRKRRE